MLTDTGYRLDVLPRVHPTGQPSATDILCQMSTVLYLCSKSQSCTFDDTIAKARSSEKVHEAAHLHVEV